MASVFRLSRFIKIATATAAGGSLYLFRDEIKPYLRTSKLARDASSHKPHNDDQVSRQKQKFIENLPDQIPYLLVGGGTASHSAMRSIRGHDPKAKVLIVASEPYGPYMRPALSKELWFSDRDSRRQLNFTWWNGKEKSIFYEIDEFFIPIDKLVERETGGVSMLNNIRLTHLDPDNRVAYFENGQTIKYEKCLLAPGGKPKTLPELESASDDIKRRVVYFRTVDDFLRLDELMDDAKTIVIIGGGFLGSELACALSKRISSENKAPKQDQAVYQIYPESGNLGKVLPSYLSEYLSNKVEKEGAKLIPNVEVKGVTMGADKSLELKLSNGHTLKADYIVCAVGLEPDVELARTSGLEVDETTGGFLVNSELEARTNVWVAGDASCFYDIKLGRRRVEHHDHAINSGKLAGQNMVGANKAYTHQSMFWSDLGSDISFEAVGIIDSTLETISIFADPGDLASFEKSKHLDREKSSSDAESSEKTVDDTKKSEKVVDATQEKSGDNEVEEKYGRGIVFYLKDGIIVGILLWNLFGRLTIARRILNEQTKYDDLNEVAKLFNIYLDD